MYKGIGGSMIKNYNLREIPKETLEIIKKNALIESLHISSRDIEIPRNVLNAGIYVGSFVGGLHMYEVMSKKYKDKFKEQASANFEQSRSLLANEGTIKTLDENLAKARRNILNWQIGALILCTLKIVIYIRSIS